MTPLTLSHLTSVGSAAVLAGGLSCAYEPAEPLLSVRPSFVDSWSALSATATSSSRSELAESVGQEPGDLAERIIEHITYLREVFKSGLISPETAREARVAWLECWMATGYTLPVPAACTGPDGEMQYVWDRGVHHLQLTFSPSESPSFFYRNGETGELWIEDFAAGHVEPEAVEKLKLFA